MLERPARLGRVAAQMLADMEETTRPRTINVDYVQIIAIIIVNAQESEIARHHVSQHCAHAVEHRGGGGFRTRDLIHCENGIVSAGDLHVYARTCRSPVFSVNRYAERFGVATASCRATRRRDSGPSGER